MIEDRQRPGPATWPFSFKLAAGMIVVFLTVGALAVAEDVFRPFFVALFLTFAFRPMHRFLVERAGSAWLGHVLAVALVAGVIFVGGRIVANDLESFSTHRDAYVQTFRTYRADVEETLDGLEDRVTGWLGTRPAEKPADRPDPDTAAAPPAADAATAPRPTAIDASFDRIKAYASLGTAAFLDFLGSIVVVVFFMLFMMLELDRLPHRIRAVYPREKADHILAAIDEFDRSIHQYIALKVIVSFVTAAVAAVAMWLFGVHYVLTFAILIFLFNFIPYVGSLVATILPVTVSLLQPEHGIWTTVSLLATLTVLQQLIGNVIEPRIQGRGLGLSPVVILLALAFWGWLWGVTGMILAIPIAVLVRIVLSQFESTRPIARLLGDPREDPAHAPAGKKTALPV